MSITQNGSKQTAEVLPFDGRATKARRPEEHSANGQTTEQPTLATEPRILDRMAADLARAGLVGEERAAKLVYLVLTSRLLDQPLSAVIKGQSSAGKSHLVEQVKKLFPESAYVFRTSISPKALVYSDDDFKHRILIIVEAAGFKRGEDALFLRSLVTEGMLRHETVDKDMKPLLLTKEGPTGLLITTTEHQLEPELETRMLSIPIDDSPEQTTAIMLDQAMRSDGSKATNTLDAAPWHALQEWLEGAEHRVVISYARQLVMPSVANRQRRDFPAVLRAIKTHALLHQALRGKDDAGRIIATVDDYAAVYGLVVDLVSRGLGASVSPEVRQTVEAVRALLPRHRGGVPQYAIGAHLTLDRGTVSKRVKDATELGYLINEEWRSRQPAKLKPGDPLPDEVQVLPRPEQLAADK
jgi:hypothetical protein